MEPTSSNDQSILKFSDAAESQALRFTASKKLPENSSTKMRLTGILLRVFGQAEIGKNPHTLTESVADTPPFTMSAGFPHFDPKLMDPKTKLKTSLEFQKFVGTGLSGKVFVTHFKDDPVPDRLFAIKKPINTILLSYGASTSKKINQAALSAYKHNIKVAKIIGDHPNFMKVHDVVVKDKKQGTESKPYLILEYIEGRTLRKLSGITAEQKAHLLDQLDNALAHLLENDIYPFDLNFGNFIITPNNELKLIDYDAWRAPSKLSPEILKEKLTEVAAKVKKFLDRI